MPLRPRLLTFDLFGTIVDWRTGLKGALEPLGVTLDDAVDDLTELLALVAGPPEETGSA